MCGRFGIGFEQRAIEQRFGARFETELFRPRYNAAPSQSLPVILNDDPHTIQFVAWGLRPAWLTKVAKRAGLINVRAETLRERATFKTDFTQRRCLVLADSFYEWQRTGTRKIPYRITLTSGEPFAFAGIWEENIDEDGQPLRTFAIITTESNALVRRAHDRMPVLLPREAEQRWLERNVALEQLYPLLAPYPAWLMRMCEISPRVNRTTEDSPELITPVQ
jgi:putative SOS response-associated peptidase YedK